MTCRHILIISLWVLTSCLAGCQPENPDKRADAVTRLAFRYLNDHKFDSLYQLTDSGFRKLMPKNMFIGYSERLVTLAPFKNIDFVAGNDSVSLYKIEAKKLLSSYISLDKQGKIKTFSIGLFEPDLKAASMNAHERKVDVLAQEMLTMLKRRQADSMYLFAGDDLKKNVDAEQWRTNAENMQVFLPFPPAVFLRSENGTNVYALGQLRFYFGTLDSVGRFNTFYFTMYQQQEQKAFKATTDNKLKTQIDNIADKVISPYIETLDNVGVSAAVLYKGKTYFYNYGERKKGQGNLPDKHTLYDIGSITKTFTATLLAQAVNQKKLSLETPITQYLPDSVAANPVLKNITFKQLANHTAGLPREGDNYKELITNVDQPYENYDTRAMFSFLKHFRPTRRAGTKYVYSNLGFGLLGVLLERIYQQSFPELIKRYITGPLKMEETVFAVDTLKNKDWAQGYGGLAEPVPYFELQAMRGAGEIKSSAADMIAYANAQLAVPDSLLNKSIQLTHRLTFGQQTMIGLGWEYLPNAGTVLGHGGATGGYRAGMWIDLNNKIAVVVLTNNARNGGELADRLIKALQVMQ